MESYPAQFGAFTQTLNDATTPEWLEASRRGAIARFEALGFPTRRDEEWKYTRLKSIARTPFEPVASLRLDGVDPAWLDSLDVEGTERARLVFVNGHHAPSLSRFDAPLPEGVRVLPLADAWEDADLKAVIARDLSEDPNAFTALNAAFAQDGLFIHVPSGVVVEQPLHLVFISSNARQASVSHPRIVIKAERHSQLTWIESHHGRAEHPYLTNLLVDVDVAEGARVERFKLERDDEERGHHVGRLRVQQAAHSRFLHHVFTLGGRLVRDNIDARLDGEGIECTLNGLYMTRGEQHIDHHTCVDHTHPHCNSYELYKGVLDDRSTGVFNGKVFVRQAAQKTDAKQSNRNLLLSPHAVINTKPQLEIWADDVRCTHGATIGQLDETALFYMRSRGLSPHEAKALLTYAFAGEVVERVTFEPLQAQLEAAVHQWFGTDIGR